MHARSLWCAAGLDGKAQTAARLVVHGVALNQFTVDVQLHVGVANQQRQRAGRSVASW